ncbi:MAG: ACT domain-containing protein, partial [Ancalomicrobiaceae bacterium]|nr:ACT domain-containing protein [Ancalomicrobiaceae bacterium]
MSGDTPRPALTLTLMPVAFTILKLPAEAVLPAWAASGRVWQVSRTLEEMTVVVDASAVPADQPGERTEGWRCLRISEVFDFSAPGILASVLAPIAQAGIGIFA